MSCPHRFRPWTAADDAAVVALAEARRSDAAIGAALNRSAEAVRHRVKHLRAAGLLGVKRRERNEFTPKDIERAFELAEQGLGVVAIGRLIGRAHASVRGLLRSAGRAPQARPNAAMLADRDTRLCAPLTANQLLLGDPAPGRSALDRRNA